MESDSDDWHVSIKNIVNIPRNRSEACKVPIGTPNPTECKKRCQTTKDLPKRLSEGKGLPFKLTKAKMITLMDKQTANINAILTYSNATPIRTRLDTGYACCFCDATYPDPADLKRHSIEHTDHTQVIKKVRSSKLLLKLDITALYCIVCEETTESLEILLQHLKDAHDTVVYDDVQNQVVPFKFHGETLQCHICCKSFTNFKLLLQHMNQHFKNYVCEICGDGFLNQMSFNNHKRTHQIGRHRCNRCSQKFDTLQKKNLHERNDHKLERRYKCGYCSEKFTSHRRKVMHLTEKHGFVPKTFNCHVCGKQFEGKFLMDSHVRRVHMMEKSHACEFCNMFFFNKRELDQHAVKHTGVREFKCDICSKTFARKKTLRQHMRIHENDRAQDEVDIDSDSPENDADAPKEDEGLEKEIKIEWLKHTINLREILLCSNATVIGSYRGGLSCSYCKSVGDEVDIPSDRSENETEEQSFTEDQSNLDKMKHTLKEILLRSNATPVGVTLHDGVKCVFCKRRFENLPDLKIHTNEHPDARKEKYSEKSMCKLSNEGMSKRKGKLSVKQEVLDEQMSEKVKMRVEREKHYNNIRQVLAFSNATAIRTQSDGFYLCCFCDDMFSEPADLKVHNIQQHCGEDIKNATFLRRTHLNNLHVKLDITGLQCSLCDEGFENIEPLMEHLRDIHDKVIHTDINHRLVPFKFQPGAEKELLSCFICFNVFNKLKTLFNHMNTHYRNFICDVCDAGFVTKTMAVEHGNTHIAGTFECRFCPEVFPTRLKRTNHERFRHTHADGLNVCRICEKRFKSYFQKELHLKEVHGVGANAKCQACERVFNCQKKLRYHKGAPLDG
ncbi:hypothetical protein NE865_15853 [Phthorimaea operculella]|nr:hypothetical protein NE865_15853 [Phthorimaea operculella]